jgi:hypothetical protein
MMRFEWIIIEAIILGFAFWELWKLRRLRREREAKARLAKPEPPGDSA